MPEDATRCRERDHSQLVKHTGPGVCAEQLQAAVAAHTPEGPPAPQAPRGGLEAGGLRPRAQRLHSEVFPGLSITTRTAPGEAAGPVLPYADIGSSWPMHSHVAQATLWLSLKQKREMKV